MASPRARNLDSGTRAIEAPLPGVSDRLTKQALKVGSLAAGGNFLRAQRRLEAAKQGVAVFHGCAAMRIRLHGDDAHDSKQVRHSMPRLRNDELLFGILSLAFGHVLKDDENA